MAGSSDSRYREIKTFHDQDGVVCVVTERLDTDTPYHSFAFFKTYEKNGQPCRTSYLSRRHTAAIRRLLVQLEEFLDQEVEKNFARTWQDEGRRAAR